MLYIEGLFSVNRFHPRAIPSARKLFERYGYSRVTDGHPDNIDPYHFGAPSNPQGVVPNVGSVSLGASVADSLIARSQQPAATPDGTKTDSETQPEKSE